MISFPSILAKQEKLAEAVRRYAAAQARLDAIDAEAAKLDAATGPTTSVGAVMKINARRDALWSERSATEAERIVADAIRTREARQLGIAETVDQRAALDTRCAEFAETMLSDFPPPAKKVVALMATSRRLHSRLKEAEKRAAPMRMPRMAENLISAEFCASLRLIDLTPDGVKGYLWSPNDPARIDDIKTEDAVPLDEIRIEAFAGGEEEDERAARGAAKAAAQAIVAAYEDSARRLISLFEKERELVLTLERLNLRMDLFPAPPILTPAQRITGGRISELSRATRLPAPDGRKMLW